MPLGGPGPRDWSPPNDPSARWQGGSPSHWAAPSATSRHGTRPWGYATLSMLLGGGSVVLALVEPQQSGIANGFIASSIGLVAIAAGVRAMQISRWIAPFSRAFGRGGIILGSVGSALMTYAVIATALLSTGIAELPALSLPVDGTGGPTVARGFPLPRTPGTPGTPGTSGSDTGEQSDPAIVDDAPAPSPQDDSAAITPYAVPGLPPIVDKDSEAEALMIATGWLSYRLHDDFFPGPLPETLTVGMSSPQRIVLADGTPLTPVPDGTRVFYQVSADRTEFNVTLVGGTYGAVATTSSAVGIVEAG